MAFLRQGRGVQMAFPRQGEGCDMAFLRQRGRAWRAAGRHAKPCASYSAACGSAGSAEKWRKAPVKRLGSGGR